jgi:hypothetical protein
MKIKYLIHSSKGIMGATYNKEVAECLQRNLVNASIEEIEILEEDK